MTPLEKMSESVMSADLHLFEIRDAIGYRSFRHKGNTGHKMFIIAPNPPEGALVSYYVKEEGESEVHITVTDASGRVVRELEGSGQRGLNRANWDLRYDGPIPDASTGGFGAPPPGPRVLPGTYTVKVALGDHEATRSVSVSDDPNVRATSSDRRAHLDYLLELRRLISDMHEAHQMAADLDEQLASLETSLEKADTVPESVTTALAAR